MVMYRHQNARQNHNFMICNRRLENVAKFEHFGTTVTDQNRVHEGTCNRMKSGNVYFQ
jgi:hypothetical protein